MLNCRSQSPCEVRAIQVQLGRRCPGRPQSIVRSGYSSTGAEIGGDCTCAVAGALCFCQNGEPYPGIVLPATAKSNQDGVTGRAWFSIRFGLVVVQSVKVRKQVGVAVQILQVIHCANGRHSHGSRRVVPSHCLPVVRLPVRAFQQSYADGQQRRRRRHYRRTPQPRQPAQALSGMLLTACGPATAPRNTATAPVSATRPITPWSAAATLLLGHRLSKLPDALAPPEWPVPTRSAPPPSTLRESSTLHNRTLLPATAYINSFNVSRSVS